MFLECSKMCEDFYGFVFVELQHTDCDVFRKILLNSKQKKNLEEN